MDGASQQVTPIAGFGAIAEVPGSAPLRRPSHERYARARSMLRPKIEAYRYAFEHPERDDEAPMTVHALRGNASKVERRKDVQARIAWLTRQDEDVLAAKRRRLEEFLWEIHEANYADFWTTRTAFERDEDGEILLDSEGKPRERTFQDIRMFGELPVEHQRLIESLKYTEKGRPILATYSKLEANKELRKLLGVNVADEERGQSEFDRMSDRELFTELARQAQELGVNVTLSYDGTPSARGA